MPRSDLFQRFVGFALTPRALVKFALVLLLLSLAFADVSWALANVLVKVDTARAVALAPGNGKILGAFAKARFATQREIDNRTVELAMAALRKDPTAVGALTVLGFKAQMDGDQAKSKSILNYSILLSRRELRPQLWAVEDAVNRGDIRSALLHYDIAMRTSRDARDLAFPILVSASKEPKIRTALVGMLKRHPSWSESFLDYSSRNRTTPLASLALFREMEDRGFPPAEALRAELVNALVFGGKALEAWLYYASYNHGVMRDHSRNSDFNARPAVQTPFDWTTDGDAGTYASIVPNIHGGSLEFSLPPAVGGTLVRQMQLLPPGRYILSGKGASLSPQGVAGPYLSLSCVGGGELGRVELPDADDQERSFRREISVSDGCPVQMLSLVARPVEDIMGVSGRVLEAQLIPASTQGILQ